MDVGSRIRAEDVDSALSRRRFLQTAGATVALAGATKLAPLESAAAAPGADAGFTGLIRGASGDLAAVARDLEEGLAVFDAIQRIGATTVRFPLRWEEVQRDPTGYDFSDYQGLCKQLVWHGFGHHRWIAKVPVEMIAEPI